MQEANIILSDLLTRKGSYGGPRPLTPNPQPGTSGDTLACSQPCLFPLQVCLLEARWDSVCTDCVYLTHLLLLARHALYIPRIFYGSVTSWAILTESLWLLLVSVSPKGPQTKEVRCSMVPLCHSSRSWGGNHLPLSRAVLTLGLHFSPKAEIPGAAGSKTRIPFVVRTETWV